MQQFKLPEIYGEKSSHYEVIYTGCDENYYELYAVPLIISILNQIDWIAVHCHVVFENNYKEIFLKHPRLTHTYEIIDDNFINSIPINSKATMKLEKYDTELTPKIIYFASCRFMQLEKIFEGDKRILQIDSDSILFKPFSKKDFYQLTDSVRAMRKPKSPEKIMASTLSCGNNNEGILFRKKLSKKMFEVFSSGAYWFVDQVVLQDFFSDLVFEPISLEWNTWSFKKRSAFFRTAKGNKKETNEMYKAAVDFWKNQSLTRR